MEIETFELFWVQDTVDIKSNNTSNFKYELRYSANLLTLNRFSAHFFFLRCLDSFLPKKLAANYILLVGEGCFSWCWCSKEQAILIFYFRRCFGRSSR